MNPTRPTRFLILTAAALLIGAGPALATPILVDGDLSDWGVSVADNDGTDYSGLISGLLGYMVEDQSDTAGDAGFVGPNVGGQNYDAEFLGATLQGTTLFLALLSGQRPDNGLARYAPGDFYFRVKGGGTYGIEVGGGAGGGTGTTITEGANGSSYTLNANGFTTAHTSHTTRQAGSIWKDPTWYFDPIAPGAATQMITGTGTLVGNADFVFTRNTFTSQHSIIELSLDTTLLDWFDVESIEWRPSCGNDELDPDVETPEPGLVGLLGMALVGCAWLRRRA
jgi:hypothetical protein